MVRRESHNHWRLFRGEKHIRHTHVYVCGLEHLGFTSVSLKQSTLQSIAAKADIQQITARSDIKIAAEKI